MTRSMTGFGRSENTLDNRKYSVEIKSVNHKFCELNLKLPRFLNEYEAKFRETISKKVSRGKVDVYINFETFSENDYNVTFNEELGKIYHKELCNAISTLALNDSVKLGHIIGMQDIIKTEKNFDNEETVKLIADHFMTTISLALDKFILMRENEGKKLEEDILQKIANFKTIVQEIEEQYPKSVEQYKNKLTEKANKVFENKEFDENRIIMEVMLFTDKVCVDEEVIRLYSHIEQFYNILKENGPIGRKTDFLIQEINREVNTIASKTTDIKITNNVVELKTLLEKIREQVQNIE